MVREGVGVIKEGVIRNGIREECRLWRVWNEWV